MHSDRAASDRAVCLYVAACGILAIAWMVWVGPGAGPPPFVGIPWWGWPIEAFFLGLTWFVWTLMIGTIGQVAWLLGQALVLSCVLLLRRHGNVGSTATRRPRTS